MQAKHLIRDAYGNTTSELQAQKLLLDVVRQDEKFAPAYVQLANVTASLGYISTNKYEPAALEAQQQYLKKALSLEPDYDQAIGLMGFSKMMQGKLTEAELFFTRLKEMDSGYPYLWAQLSELEVKRKNYEAAVELAKKGYEENKSDPTLATNDITQILIFFFY